MMEENLLVLISDASRKNCVWNSFFLFLALFISCILSGVKSFKSSTLFEMTAFINFLFISRVNCACRKRTKTAATKDIVIKTWCCFVVIWSHYEEYNNKSRLKGKLSLSHDKVQLSTNPKFTAMRSFAEVAKKTRWWIEFQSQ
jgi:hypothetical protein